MISRFLQAIVRSRGMYWFLTKRTTCWRSAEMLRSYCRPWRAGDLLIQPKPIHIYTTHAVFPCWDVTCWLMGCDATLAPKYRELLHKFGWWTYYFTWAIASTKQLSPAQPWDHFLTTTWDCSALLIGIVWNAFNWVNPIQQAELA